MSHFECERVCEGARLCPVVELETPLGKCCADIPLEDPGAGSTVGAEPGTDVACDDPLCRCGDCWDELMLSGGGSSATTFLPDPESRFRRCNSARISDAC